MIEVNFSHLQEHCETLTISDLVGMEESLGGRQNE